MLQALGSHPLGRVQHVSKLSGLCTRRGQTYTNTSSTHRRRVAYLSDGRIAAVQLPKLAAAQRNDLPQSVNLIWQ